LSHSQIAGIFSQLIKFKKSIISNSSAKEY
jgi:hypothetical protein